MHKWVGAAERSEGDGGGLHVWHQKLPSEGWNEVGERERLKKMKEFISISVLVCVCVCVSFMYANVHVHKQRRKKSVCYRLNEIQRDCYY